MQGQPEKALTSGNTAGLREQLLKLTGACYDPSIPNMPSIYFDRLLEAIYYAFENAINKGFGVSKIEINKHTLQGGSKNYDGILPVGHLSRTIFETYVLPELMHTTGITNCCRDESQCHNDPMLSSYYSITITGEERPLTDFPPAYNLANLFEIVRKQKKAWRDLFPSLVPSLIQEISDHPRSDWGQKTLKSVPDKIDTGVVISCVTFSDGTHYNLDRGLDPQLVKELVDEINKHVAYGHIQSKYRPEDKGPISFLISKEPDKSLDKSSSILLDCKSFYRSLFNFLEKDVQTCLIPEIIRGLSPELSHNEQIKALNPTRCLIYRYTNANGQPINPSTPVIDQGQLAYLLADPALVRQLTSKIESKYGVKLTPGIQTLPSGGGKEKYLRFHYDIPGGARSRFCLQQLKTEKVIQPIIETGHSHIAQIFAHRFLENYHGPRDQKVFHWVYDGVFESAPQAFFEIMLGEPFSKATINLRKIFHLAQRNNSESLFSFLKKIADSVTEITGGLLSVNLLANDGIRATIVDYLRWEYKSPSFNERTYVMHD